MLDLFAGAGGAARGYHDAGFDVLGVDHVFQRNYPYRFVVMDPLIYLQEEVIDRDHPFVAIHARPGPLADPLRELLIRTELPYVIEHIIEDPERRRHRYEVKHLGLMAANYTLEWHHDSDLGQVVDETGDPSPYTEFIGRHLAGYLRARPA